MVNLIQSQEILLFVVIVANHSRTRCFNLFFQMIKGDEVDMVLTAKDWGFEDTKKWFEAQCRFGLSMSEQAWDLVIVPLFNEIAELQAAKEDAETKLKYADQECEKLMNWHERDKKIMAELHEKIAKVQKMEKIKMDFPIKTITTPFTTGPSPYTSKLETELQGPISPEDFFAHSGVPVDLLSKTISQLGFKAVDNVETYKIDPKKPITEQIQGIVNHRALQKEKDNE